MLKNSKIIYCGRRSGDVSHIYADLNKFKKTFFWKPKYNNIKKILLSSIRWQKKLQNYLFYYLSNIDCTNIH